LQKEIEEMKRNNEESNQKIQTLRKVNEQKLQTEKHILSEKIQALKTELDHKKRHQDDSKQKSEQQLIQIKTLIR
jgi:hypothetical protein